MFLNAIMAILLVAVLPIWIVLVFLFVAALGDILSELRPQARLLSPFIIPANVELIYATPKILYTVGGLRLRAADLLWYGLLTGLVSPLRFSPPMHALLVCLVAVVCILAHAYMCPSCLLFVLGCVLQVVYTSSSSRDYASVLLGGTLIVLCVLSALALLLFVGPFVGVRVRPLPVAILTAFVLTMIQQPVLEPFLASQNAIWDEPISFATD
jgi:hypothetical protein